MWSTVQNRKRSADLIFMLFLDESIAQLAMANNKQCPLVWSCLE